MKYNPQLLNQLLNDRWNEEGLNLKVNYDTEVRSFFSMVSANKIIPKKTPLNYEELADEFLESIKEILNKAGTEEVSLIPFETWTESRLWLQQDKYFSVLMQGTENPLKLWKDVGIRVQMKVVYPKPKEVYLSEKSREFILDYLY